VKVPSRSAIGKVLIVAAAVVAISGCAHYQPQPLSPGRTDLDFESRRLDDPSLKKFLEKNHVELPVDKDPWDLQKLTFVALNTTRLALDEARRQSAEARVGVADALLGMLPLAYGIGSGADMLRPLAVSVIGVLCISLLLSLVATPTVYYNYTMRSFARD